MKQSEQIDTLVEALAKAQGAFINPPRNREVTVVTKAGKSYSFAYATLDAIMDTVRGPLSSNGLAVTHSLGTDDQGPICETRLSHASGQWIETWTPVIVSAESDAQMWGSALTYARRYGLCSLLAIAADEDDDGNAACGNRTEASDRKPALKRNGNVSAPPKPTPKPASLPTADEYKERLDNAAKALHPVQATVALVSAISQARLGDRKEEVVAYGREKLGGRLIVAACETDSEEAWQRMEALAETWLLPEQAEEVKTSIQNRREQVAATVHA